MEASDQVIILVERCSAMAYSVNVFVVVKQATEESHRRRVSQCLYVNKKITRVETSSSGHRPKPSSPEIPAVLNYGSVATPSLSHYAERTTGMSNIISNSHV